MAKKLKKYQKPTTDKGNEVRVSPFTQKLTPEQVDSLKKRREFMNSLVSSAQQDSVIKRFKELGNRNKKD
jgi:hypothetical protein